MFTGSQRSLDDLTLMDRFGLIARSDAIDFDQVLPRAHRREISCLFGSLGSTSNAIRFRRFIGRSFEIRLEADLLIRKQSDQDIFS